MPSFFETLPSIFSWNPLRFWWVILIALALDFFVAYPPRLLHPVALVGNLIALCEKPARSVKNLRLAGVCVLVFFMVLVGSVVGFLVLLPYGLSLLAAIFLLWTGLALGSLLRAGRAALAFVEAGNLDEARRTVGGLVTRDTSTMDSEALCRTLAETISENLNDAFVAPFFWLQCAGPVGLWVYKVVSTMDSMWGYKTERWLHLGWAGARLDDVLAFIPARITAFLYFITAPIAKVPLRWPGWSQVATQAGMMESPNAGWPMAAAAWLHGAGMGGAAMYNGEPMQKPLLGPISGHWDVERVRGLLRHTAVAGIFGAFFLWCLAAIVSYWAYHA